MKKCAYAYQLCKLAEGCQYPDPGGDWFKLRQISMVAKHCSEKGPSVREGEYQNLTPGDILARREERAHGRKVRRANRALDAVGRGQFGVD